MQRIKTGAYALTFMVILVSSSTSFAQRRKTTVDLIIRGGTLVTMDGSRRVIENGGVDMVVIATQLSDADRVDQLQTLCTEHRVSLTRLLFKLDRLIVAS